MVLSPPLLPCPQVETATASFPLYLLFPGFAFISALTPPGIVESKLEGKGRTHLVMVFAPLKCKHCQIWDLFVFIVVFSVFRASPDI